MSNHQGGPIQRITLPTKQNSAAIQYTGKRKTNAKAKGNQNAPNY
jgi:hypothetical protein